MNVFVVDRRLDRFGTGWARYARRYPGGGSTFQTDAGWTIQSICGEIITRSGQGRLDTLFLCAHGPDPEGGGPARIQLGEGLTVQTARHFSSLRNSWSDRGRIEVHSCLVASTTRTRWSPNPAYRDGWQQDLDNVRRYLITRATVRPRIGRGTAGPSAIGHAVMQALANAAQVEVVAGVDRQEPDRHFMFEGPIHSYRPGAGA